MASRQAFAQLLRTLCTDESASLTSGAARYSHRCEALQPARAAVISAAQANAAAPTEHTLPSALPWNSRDNPQPPVASARTVLASPQPSQLPSHRRSVISAAPIHTATHSPLHHIRWMSSAPASGSGQDGADGPSKESTDGKAPQGGIPSAPGPEQQQEGPGVQKLSLHEALSRLVDAAVEMVEAGRGDEAISLLKEGIDTFTPNFPDSAELGELHNQVALLTLVEGDVETAAGHAATGLDITRKNFPSAGLLVGHRQLRLGVVEYARGRINEAAGLLHSALEALTAAKDNSSCEASFYLALCLLSGTRDVAKVAMSEGRLVSDMKAMVDTYGPGSMIVSFAIQQHERLVHQALAAAEPDGLLCEALLKQHIRLRELIDPSGEGTALAHYKLATFYYVQDMLSDAQASVRRAGTVLRESLPEDHELVVLCKHRLGMICAAQGDHRAATQLLTLSHDKFTGGGGGATEQANALSGLAREARLGLAIALYHKVAATVSGEGKDAALKDVRARLDELGAALGTSHMLTRGGIRHFAHLQAKARG